MGQLHLANMPARASLVVVHLFRANAVYGILRSSGADQTICKFEALNT